ncbi:unnamed protein product, partial [Mesorhabditis spiculigera]
MDSADFLEEKLGPEGVGWASKSNAADSELIFDIGSGYRVRKIVVTPHSKYMPSTITVLGSKHREKNAASYAVIGKIKSSVDRNLKDFENAYPIYCDKEMRWILLKLDHSAEEDVSNIDKRVGLKRVDIFGYHKSGKGVEAVDTPVGVPVKPEEPDSSPETRTVRKIRRIRRQLVDSESEEEAVVPDGKFCGQCGKARQKADCFCRGCGNKH